MKRTIIVATGLLLLAGCTPDPGAPNTRGTVSETGGPAMQFSARGGYLEMSEADRYEFMCKDSPHGSRKVSYWSDLVPTCVDGIYRLSELCKDAPKGSHKQTWVIDGYGCYDGVPVSPQGHFHLLP